MSVTINAAEFNRGLDNWMRQFKVDSDKAMRHIASKLFENIIRRTPVDTGWARGNWYPSLNARLETKPGDRPFDAANVPPSDPAQVVAAGKAGDVFWLQNGVPYIGNLENGTSQQAPEGMVKLSIAEAREFFRKWAVDVKGAR